MIRRIAFCVCTLGALVVVLASDASAGIVYRRVAPVRRVAARAALPPYPLARRAVVGPVYRPALAPYRAPVFYGPGFYGPGVSVHVGY